MHLRLDTNMGNIYFDSSIQSFLDDELHAEDAITANAHEIDAATHQTMLTHLNNGGRIELKGSEFVFIPTPPDAYHVWNVDTGAWETNADLQAAKLSDWRANVAEITPKQLRLVLLENGINAKAVETAIAEIADETIREVAMIEWNYATGYQRNNENLIMIATDLLGLDALKIDAMWKAAILK